MEEVIRRSSPVSDKDKVPRSSAWAVVGLLILLCIGIGRLYWSARSGSEEFASSIHRLAGATVGAVLDLRTPAEAHPDAQWDFWHAEIDRILASHPDDAELHAAAAVVLSEPSWIYVSELSRVVAEESGSDPWSLASGIFEQLREARARFDKKGSKRATELIRRATELDPDDPRWWRLRAVLLWPSPVSSQEREPLDPDWEQVLQAAKEHDAGNALYSLLQACWASEQAVDFDEHGEFVGNPDAWREAIEYSKESVANPHLTLGEPAMRGLVRLHTLSRHPLATTTESIHARFIASRAVYPAAILVRNLMRIAGAEELSGNYEARAELLSLAQQVLDLALERSDKIARYDQLLVQLRTRVWRAIEELERERGEIPQAVMDEAEDAVRWQNAFQKAATDFQQQKQRSAGAVSAAVSAIALPLFAASLAVALFCIAAWLICSRSPASLRLRFWPFGLFALGVGLSLLFLGAGPARLVPETVQRWASTALSFAVLLSIFGGVALRSRLRLRFSTRSLLIGSAAAASVLSAVFHLGLDWAAIGVHGSPDPLLNAIRQQAPDDLDEWLPGPTWVSRLTLQWLAHDGPSWGVAIFFGFVLIAFLWQKNAKSFVGQLLIASVVLTILWLNVWAWAEPAIYANTRPVQMRHESYIQSMDEYYEPFEELLEQAVREE